MRSVPVDPRYLMELLPFDEDHLTPEVEHLSAADIRECPTIAELRELFGADRGALTDPAGDEHFVASLEWPKLPHTTRVLIRWHRILDDGPVTPLSA